MANDAQLNILIKAKNEAKAEFDKLNKQVNELQGKTGGGGITKLNSAFKEFTGTSLGAATAIGAAGLAAQKLFQFLRQSVDETEKYVTAMVDGARVTGMNVEEYSRLVQASDDLFISQEKLQPALLAATRQGIDVSTEGLKNLSEQYLRLNPKAERGEFLMRTFGRSGADMGKLMEVGAAGIDAAMAAISDSLVVTAQSQINIENYKRSVDNLRDSWQGVKYTIGNELIPELDLLMRVFTEGKDDVEIHAQAVNTLENKISKLAVAAAWGNQNAKDAIAGLEAELATLQETAPSVSGDMATLAGDVSDVTQYFKDLTAEMIFNRLATNMDADAQMALAREMGLINETTFTTLTMMDQLTTKYDTNGDGVIDLTEKTGQYNQELAKIIEYQNGLSDKTVTYTIYTNQITTNGPVIGGGQLAKPSAGMSMQTKAIGGPVQAGIPVQVNELGQEIFIPETDGTIIPHNKIGAAGGHPVNVYVNYSPAISLSDRTEVMTKLKPLILEAMRQ